MVNITLMVVFMWCLDDYPATGDMLGKTFQLLCFSRTADSTASDAFRLRQVICNGDCMGCFSLFSIKSAEGYSFIA